MGNVGKAYFGMELDKDYYYLMLKRREDIIHTSFYNESRRYFEEKYEGVKWETYPHVDDNKNESGELGEILSDMDISQGDLNTIERVNRISRNEFFIAAAILSIAIYNKSYNVMISWIYNGREDMELMSTVGLLFRELPVAVNLNKSMTLRDLFKEVHLQVQKGIEHSCYPYVDKTNSGTLNDAAYLLYQQDLRDNQGMEGMEMETVDIRQNQAATQTMLDIEILDGSDGLEVMIDYAAGIYKDESMEKFRLLFMRTVDAMISHDSQDDISLAEIKKEIDNKKPLITVALSKVKFKFFN
jgi:hypothetical protein